MSYIKLDTILRNYCREHGGTYLHKWGHYYPHALNAVKDIDASFGSSHGVLYRFVPVEGGRAFIPGDITVVSEVGIMVGGHFQQLHLDQNMMDRDDDCGALTPSESVNPDIPSVRSNGKTQAPILYTGQVGGGTITGGYGGYYGGGYGTGWFGGGYGLGYCGYGQGWRMYTPAQGGMKSIYGYYRIFAERGYVLLEKDCPFDHIVLKCHTRSFTPGMNTLVNELAEPYIKAWITAKTTANRAEVYTKDRPMVAFQDQERKLEKALLRQRIGREGNHLFQLWAGLEAGRRLGPPS